MKKLSKKSQRIILASLLVVLALFSRWLIYAFAESPIVFVIIVAFSLISSFILVFFVTPVTQPEQKIKLVDYTKNTSFFYTTEELKKGW